ncbi:hypothetical protein A9Q86_15735 [Flavobacteriales bacterium 33_180_T64]|nr:hypothetical protein A9Q86_15735 [Flavobacteriales bacterium 33_180_T64]
MNLEDINIQNKIEAYILGKMGANEKKAFKKLISTTPLLKEEVNIQQSLHSVFNENIKFKFDKNKVNKIKVQLKNNEFQELSDHIKNTHKVFEKNRNNKISFYKYASVAVAAIFILFIIIFNPNDLNDYYNEYENWEDLPSYIEQGNNETDNLYKIERYYNEERYHEIIKLINSNLNEETNINPEKLIYLGASYFKVNDTKKALKTFDELTISGHVLNSRGYWYKLLIYLKTNNAKKTSEILEIITSNPSYYKHKEAIKIHESL